MKILISLLIIATAASLCHSQDMTISYKEILKNNDRLSSEIAASYPQVDFGPDALMGVRGIASDINADVERIVNGMISDFESGVNELEHKTINGNGSQLDISSDASVTGGSLFSARLTKFSYYAGAAHPMTIISTFNYSTFAYGEIDSIGKLFRTDSGYLKFISNYCITKLREHAVKEGYDNIDDMIVDGASAKEENYKNWYVESDSLVIIFNPYQAGPYVMGIQTVSIALSEMTAMIDPKGPLEFMYR
jgi:hypothetical protein